MPNLLLGVTGSVAAVRAPELAGALAALGPVKVAATVAALAFFDPADLPECPDLSLPARGQATLYLDQDEWPQGRRFQVGEPVLHIELRRWAEVLVIAPLDAHTLAKLALGLCDNLLTCVYRAWDRQRPVVLAPAMNTHMWEHPTTARHLSQLQADFGGAHGIPGLPPDELCESINVTCPLLRVVPPQSRRLACGDEGMGALADPGEVAAAVRSLLRA